MEKRRPGENITHETRGLSYEAVDKEKRATQIIECLKEDPMTAKEIAVALYRKGLIPSPERNYTAPRLTELSQKGLVEPAYKKVCQYSGKKVAVYALTGESDG